MKIENKDFLVLQSVLPLLVASQLIFPYPEDLDYTNGQKFAVALKLVESFDMMDLLSDVGCVQKSGVGLQVKNKDLLHNFLVKCPQFIYSKVDALVFIYSGISLKQTMVQKLRENV